MKWVAALACAAAFAALSAVARAQLAAPSPSPSPTPSRCASLLTLGIASKTVAPCTVPTYHFDLETTYTNTVFTGAAPFEGNYIEVPQALLRLGTANPDFDIEFTLPGQGRSTIGAPLSIGTTDFGVAAKYELAQSEASEYSIKTEVTLPTGSDGFSAGNAQFMGDFDWSYTLDKTWNASGTLSFNALSVAAGPFARSYFQFEPSVLFTATLGGSSELGAEYVYDSAYLPGVAGGYSTMDFSYTHTFGPHLEASATYGFSPSLPTNQRSHYLEFYLSILNKD